MSLFTKAEKKLMFALAFIQFSHIVDFMILMPLGPSLTRNFNLDPHQFGLLVSSYTFAAGFSGLISSLWADKFDRKKILMFFYFGFCSGTIFTSVADSYHSLLFARTITGVFGGVLNSLALAIISDAIVPEKRATAMGYTMMSFSLASIFGVPFSLYLANQFNWHAPFIFLGALSLFLIFFVRSSIPSMTAHINKSENSLKVFVMHFKNSNERYALLFMFFLILGHFSVIPFYSQSLVINAGLPETKLPLIYLTGGIVSIISAPMIGRLADKIGKRKIFQIFSLLSVIPIYTVCRLGPSSIPFMLALTVLFFFSMGGRMIPSTAMVTATVTPMHRGSFMSLVSSVQQFSSAIASYIAGALIENVDGKLLHYENVGWLAILFTFLAIYYNLKVKPIEGRF